MVLPALVCSARLKTANPRQCFFEVEIEARVSLTCRQALVFYVLKHLGLDEEVERRPEVQQVVLKNRREVQKAISEPELA